MKRNRLRQWGIGFGLLAAGLVAVPTTANAALVASCPPPNGALAVGSPNALGQVFHVPQKSDLTGVRVWIGDNGAGSATVSVAATDAQGLPIAGPPIATAQIALSGGPTEHAITFADPVRADVGSYAVLVEPPGTGSVAWARCSDIGGALWRSDEPAWISLSPITLGFAVDGGPADETPPITTVTAAPPELTNATALQIAFTANEVATFTCAIDGAPAAACSSPLILDAIADGRHDVRVTATDRVHNVEVAPPTVTFTVDRTAPDATATASGGRDGSHDAVVTFSADGATAFTCQLDAGPVGPCTSPATFTPDVEGPHAITVTATDAAGNTDPTPAVAALVADWSAPTLTVPESFSVDAPDGQPVVVEFEVAAADAIDPAPVVACDPASGSTFEAGDTPVACSATDANGNAATATFAITVVPPPPAAAELDVALDTGSLEIAIAEPSGGTVERPDRRTAIAHVADHTTTARLGRTGDVPALDDEDAGLRIRRLSYDGGPRLRPGRNLYAFRTWRNDDESVRRITIVAMAGRILVVVRYSTESGESVIVRRNLRTGEVLETARRDGLVVPHLVTAAGHVHIVVVAGGDRG